MHGSQNINYVGQKCKFQDDVCSMIKIKDLQNQYMVFMDTVQIQLSYKSCMRMINFEIMTRVTGCSNYTDMLFFREKKKDNSEANMSCAYLIKYIRRYVGVCYIILYSCLYAFIFYNTNILS